MKMSYMLENPTSLAPRNKNTEEDKNWRDHIESTVKSIANEENLSFKFSDICYNFGQINQHNFYQDPINVPDKNNLNQFNNVRAIADLAALYVVFHDRNIQEKYSFNCPKQQKLFNNLEKARIVILGSKKYQGIGLNLRKFIEDDYLKIIEIYDIDLLLLKKSLNILEEIEVADFKYHVLSFLKDLENNIKNQDNFAQIAFDFIKKIDHELDKNKSEKDREEATKNLDENLAENFKPEKQDAKIENKNQQALNKDLEDIELPQDNGNSKSQGSNSISQIFSQAKKSYDINKIEFVESYKIFSKEFDLITDAKNLASKEELKNLREELDEKINNLDKISSKARAKLKRKLLAKKITFNEVNQEEGLLDRRKFMKIITSPLAQDNYVQIKNNINENTIVSFLIDNSGSMRGTPVAISAMACEVIAEILEKFSIKSEILGFTTSKWHGGKSKKLWQISGQPENPGRLSDLLHIIYKNSNQPLKQAKDNLALMLKEGILKENIDGEALIWAIKRLENRFEKRKILIVISDGAPVDDSTNSNNAEDILFNHLKNVIARINKKQNIELAAIGIGHDVTQLYKKSITLKDATDLGDKMIQQICQIIKSD